MGQARLLGIRAGTYRLRFEKEGFYTFEKEVSWRAGTPAPSAEATLTPAPPPAAGTRRPPTPEPPPKPASVPDLPPPVKPSTMSRARLHRAELHLGQGAAEGEPDRLQRRRADVAVAGAGTVVRPAARDRPTCMLYVVGGEGTLDAERSRRHGRGRHLRGRAPRHDLRLHPARPEPPHRPGHARRARRARSDARTRPRLRSGASGDRRRP